METCLVQGKPYFAAEHMRQFPYLTKDIETEVIVVGGGVTGSILGYFFTKAGIPTVILEKMRVAQGSTAITTSLLQYELDDTLANVSLPLADAVEAYRLGEQALGEIEVFIQTYGNQCNFMRRDTFTYTAKKNEIKLAKEEYDLRKAHGFHVEWIDASNNPFSFEVQGGVYAPHGGAELNPYRFTHHLIEVAQNSGLQVYENSGVEKVTYQTDGVTVETVFGHLVKGKILIVATGYDTARFTKRNFGSKATSYNIVTKPVPSFEGWHKQCLMRDLSNPYHYYRTTHDGRIIAGGLDVLFFPSIEKETLAGESYQTLLSQVQGMFLHIRPMEVEYAYCGAFANTLDNLGFLGKDPVHERLWYGLGYGANGILFAILGGLYLPKVFLGENPQALRLFRVNRFDK